MVVHKIGFLNGEPVRVSGISAFDAPVKLDGTSIPVDPATVQWYLKVGTERQPRCIERLDGARVLYWESYDTAKERRAGILHPMYVKSWVAFPPGGGALKSKPMGQCGDKGMRAGGNRRRWGGYAAAMKVLDKEFPCAPRA